MSFDEPLKKSKQEYTEVIKKIGLPDSPFAIDAQYTHAIVIEYLKHISQRLDKIEKILETKNIEK